MARKAGNPEQGTTKHKAAHHQKQSENPGYRNNEQIRGGPANEFEQRRHRDVRSGAEPRPEHDFDAQKHPGSPLDQAAGLAPRKTSSGAEEAPETVEPRQKRRYAPKAQPAPHQM